MFELLTDTYIRIAGIKSTYKTKDKSKTKVDGWSTRGINWCSWDTIPTLWKASWLWTLMQRCLGRVSMPSMLEWGMYSICNFLKSSKLSPHGWCWEWALWYMFHERTRRRAMCYSYLWTRFSCELSLYDAYVSMVND